MLPKFVKVIPKDYKRMLACISRAEEQGLSGDEAIMAASKRTPATCRASAATDRKYEKMGKPTGFIEYLRELPVDRTPLERVGDWKEFHPHLEEKRLRQQGARCMDCGVPFCHTGKLISGMASGCPINNLIPEWNDLVYRGLWREALDRLHMTNNFPEFTGRVCPAPCEGSCVLGINDDPPVTIKNIENAIIDRGWDEGWVVPEPPAVRTGKKVAVIGSGPGGPRRRAAAQQGRSRGHRARARRSPGRPADLRHPEHEARQARGRRAAHPALEQEGIKFLCNANVGDNVEPQLLLRDFDATVDLHGRDAAARPGRRGAQPQGRALRDGLPDREHQGGARRRSGCQPHSRAAARTSS